VTDVRHSGRCLCGEVSYRIAGELSDVVNCHCERCRRHTGHFMAATAAAVSDLSIVGGSLRWYDATDSVQYGFCGECGSSMFWRAGDKPKRISIAAGTLDPPTDVTTSAALFTSRASDYHRLDDTLVQHELDH
jgi:hypothetical protein